MEIKIKTQSAEETMAVGEKLAKSLFSPCVVSLAGDLGAGKTTFCKGFARGLGINENITSPTFTLMNEYAGGKKLYHFDLYRLSDTEEFRASGFEEYFDLTRLDGITVVEWASNCPGILPARHIAVRISKPDLTTDAREVTIEPQGLV